MPQQRFTRSADALFLSLLVLSLITSCVIISSRKFFWNDELYSYYLLADPNFFGMLAAFADKINNSPPLYFLLGWVWVQLFGASELSLRLFSSVASSAAAILIWLGLRHAYRHWVVAVGVIGTFALSALVLDQNAEARMYGLFLATCALGILLHVRTAGRERPSWRALAATALVHGAIVSTHLFGLFFSLATVVATVLSDRRERVFRPMLYGATLAGWLALLPYIPAFLVQADAGNPRAWIPEPSLLSLVRVYLLEAPFLIMLPLFALAALLRVDRMDVGHRAEASGGSMREQIRARRSALLTVAAMWLLVPLVVWVISRTLTPMFVPRYFEPTMLAWAILLTDIASRLRLRLVARSRWPAWPPRGLLGLTAASTTGRPALLLLAPILLAPLVYALNTPRPQAPPGAADATSWQAELPIVVQFSHPFLQRVHYAPIPGRYRFVLDREAALSPDSGLFGPQEFKHMEALLRQYPALFAGLIVDGVDFLEAHDRFLVLTFRDYDARCGLEPTYANFLCPQWLRMRVLADPRYTIEPLGPMSGRFVMLEVRRTEPGPAVAAQPGKTPITAAGSER